MLVAVRSHAPSSGHTWVCADWMWHPDRLTSSEAAQSALTKRLFSIFSEVLELGSSRVRRCSSRFYLARRSLRLPQALASAGEHILP